MLHPSAGCARRSLNSRPALPVSMEAQMKCLARRAGVLTLIASAAIATAAIADEAKIMKDATEVYQELLSTPDRGVPEALLKNATCIAVIPHSVKGAIGYGARFGSGVMSCRAQDGSWSAPAFVDLRGGSWGLQLGAEATDLVIFFMSERGAKSLMNSSQVTLGGKLSVAAGPVGRSAEASTDLKLNAEMYTYAKSKGLFAGISLEGARLSKDDKSTKEYYGAGYTAKALLFDHKHPPAKAEATAFVSALP